MRSKPIRGWALGAILAAALATVATAQQMMPAMRVDQKPTNRATTRRLASLAQGRPEQCRGTTGVSTAGR